jgi:EPS-associated MarR family transcriptional regulator
MPPGDLDEFRYKIMQLVEANPSVTQREVASRLGISVGKTNFCLKALIDKGVLKATSFCNSRNKRAYAYVLTPSGIEEKALLTLRFLKKKREEYEVIQREIAELTEQAHKLALVGALGGVDSADSVAVEPSERPTSARTAG